MKTMSAQLSSRRRRRPLMTWLAAALVGAAVLAGCSSHAGESRDIANSWEGGEVSSSYDMAPPMDGGFAGEARTSTPEANRSIIVTGHMYMTVEDPIASADRVAQIVIAAGGRIDERGEVTPHERSGGSAYLTMRIPAQRLDAVVADLRDLGTVDEYSTSRYDVTNQVIDVEARISTLRASTGRIEQLLDSAEDISDIIQLENELARRQAELESLEARQRGLHDEVDLSTIYLSLTTEPVVVVDDSPDSFWDAVVKGWNGLVSFVGDAVVALGLALPALLTTIVVLALVVWIVRRRLVRRARAKATADSAEPAKTEA